MDGNIINSRRIDKQKEFEPTYTKMIIHPEEGEEFRLNTALSEIETDIIKLDDGFKDIATNIDYLLKNTINRLEAVKNNINSEKERLQDITMLCNKFTDFDNVMILQKDDFTGSFNYQDGIFSSEVLGNTKISTRVENVYGNGYEGNKYAFKDGAYLSDSLDTSVRSAINDSSITSYYEYSRITASNTEEFLLNDFNTDSEEAKCTISLSGSSTINEVEILSENEQTVIVGAQYSKNGTDFEHLEIKPTTLNSKEESYKEYDYIYGSGKIAFPNCKKIKLTLQSKGYTSDTIAFERKMTEVNGIKVKDKTTVIKTGKRHTIKINDISCYQKTYSTSSVLESKELISDKAFSIAVFCNTYIPTGLNDNAVSFVLTINGEDYDVVPINSHANGIKVIRFSQGKSSPEYTKYIGEEIKSAILTIKFKGKNNVAPYINNLKILLGGEI